MTATLWWNNQYGFWDGWLRVGAGCVFVHEKLETHVIFTWSVQSGFCGCWGTIPSSGLYFRGLLCYCCLPLIIPALSFICIHSETSLLFRKPWIISLNYKGTNMGMTRLFKLERLEIPFTPFCNLLSWTWVISSLHKIITSKSSSFQWCWVGAKTPASAG